MNVLKPKLINIGGRQYRHLTQLNLNNTDTNVEKEAGISPYIEEDFYYFDEPESCRSDVNYVEKTKTGFILYIKDIPNYYFKFILGRGGEQKQAIENQTKTLIKLPKKGQDGNIEISGINQSGVLAAQSKIINIVDLNRRDQPSTHFLSINLVSDNLAESFNLFKRKVIQLNSRGIETSIFQLPQRIHVTICMLQFLNDLELSNNLVSITQTIKDLYSKHFGSEEKLCIHLKGLEYMNDDPSEVDVLYAKVEDSTKRLQDFVDELVEALSSFPCVKKERESVKLHATLMNTIFRADDINNCTDYDKPNKFGKKQRVTFDARDIFENFEDFDFAKIPVSTIDINIRGRFESSGLYCKSAEISFA